MVPHSWANSAATTVGPGSLIKVLRVVQTLMDLKEHKFAPKNYVRSRFTCCLLITQSQNYKIFSLLPSHEIYDYSNLLILFSYKNLLKANTLLVKLFQRMVISISECVTSESLGHPTQCFEGQDAQ